MLTQSAPDLQIGLIKRFYEAREETDRLFGILNRDVLPTNTRKTEHAEAAQISDSVSRHAVPFALYDRPIPERHRIIFYLGHLEAFDWNLFLGYFDLRPFQPELDQLFAFGIDPVDGGLPVDRAEDWPSIDEVETYRKRIREKLDDAVAKNWSGNDELAQLMNIAIEHRLMHAETLAYIFHQLPYSAKLPPKTGVAKTVDPVVLEMVRVPAGSAALGLRRESGEFGWDNEFEAHTVEVPAFSIDKYKVTNGQFTAFVNDGGYTRPALWLENDWEWITQSRISHPVFWVPADDGFRYRGMFAETPLPLDAPVYTSHAEACAYARWAGKELPTEAEWHRAAQGSQAPQEICELWDPPAVGSHREFESDYGVEGLIATGWEWTSTKFAPFPGFQIVPAYPGYSANFFDGKHFVMKGGSPRTAPCMLRKSFRNWFQAHYQYVYAGFRCVAR